MTKTIFISSVQIYHYKWIAWTRIVIKYDCITIGIAFAQYVMAYV